jgi:hypothetical protein
MWIELANNHLVFSITALKHVYQQNASRSTAFVNLVTRIGASEGSRNSKFRTLKETNVRSLRCRTSIAS